MHGRCCAKTGGCGGYEGGKPALEHYQDGLFGTPKTTTWRRGEPAEVYWGGPGHRGGYAYRLCKVNNGEVWKVTEECFQQGHLNFHGKEKYPKTIDNLSTRQFQSEQSSLADPIQLPR